MATLIPESLKDHLPNPSSPWEISAPLFERLSQKDHEEGGAYKKCLITSSDPEATFILKYFNHQKPPQYGIARAYCIHSPSQTQAFTGTVEKIDKAAETFRPEWDKEGNQNERQKVIDRWKKQANQFYPIKIKRPSREDTYFNVRVLPVWHGTTHAICHSIAKSGFTYFGKHHFFKSDARSGQFGSTDVGYYGSGIYFTNSAKYASMYATLRPSGQLIMAWASMKEPFPVINDRPHPQKGTDMEKLEGHGAYQTYNAHYIPVAPIFPDPNCMEYYPCYQNQSPSCDEIVVFQEAQTLPRFWIELGVDFPQTLFPHTIIPGSFIIDPLSLSKNIQDGLSVFGTCTQKNCSKNGEWVSLGKGTFDIRKQSCNTPCSSCKAPFEDVDHLLIHNAPYSIEGKLQDKTLIQQSFPPTNGILISEFSSWKFLTLTIQ